MEFLEGPQDIALRGTAPEPDQYCRCAPTTPYPAQMRWEGWRSGAYLYFLRHSLITYAI